MKKLALMALVAVMALTGCSGGDNSAAIEKYGSDTLKLFNTGEYMGENLISDFEDEFGVKVIVEYFDSNEMMYTKLMAGDSYDVVVPSDYMIERLIKEDYLTEIDKSLVPNEENLVESLADLDFDPGYKYSVPYFWGSVGLVYNKNNVSLTDLEQQGFEILKNTDYKGRIYIYDSERDAFLLALKALGYSANSDDAKELNEAYEWLVELNNTMEPAYVTDEVIDNMINGNKDIAVVYSGDAATIIKENPDMGFFMPNEGTNIWCDCMVIPKDAENPKLAHEFINYVLTYDASYDNAVTVGYASTNKDVLSDLSSEGGEFYGNDAYVPRSGYELDEVFHDNDVIRAKLSELWLRVKASK